MVTALYLYIDPGTGSLLASTLIGIAMTLVYTFKGWFYRLRYVLSGSGKANPYDYSGKLVFFSEGRGYWRVYEPVISALIERGTEAVYLTAGEDDPGLAVESPLIESHYLGDIQQAIFTLNRLKASVCVMTTPQLDVVALRRSPHVGHYCHIIHSPTDVHAYKKFAFDFFDSVLCSSEAQIENLRYLESERGTPAKELYRTGCTYYDVFAPAAEASGDHVLVAPTWGDRTFFKEAGREMLERLLGAGYRVIFRPHPQSWISDREVMQDVVDAVGDHPNLTIDRRTGGEEAIRESSILICDITSGMVFDVALAHEKPVVAVAFDWRDGGYEASDLPRDTAAVAFLDEAGAIIRAADVGQVADAVEVASRKRVTPEVVDRHIFNFRRAGKPAAEQIVSIYEKTAPCS